MINGYNIKGIMQALEFSIMANEIILGIDEEYTIPVVGNPLNEALVSHLENCYLLNV